MEELGRLDRLPPYVFATVTALKADLRRQGEDIIDLGMGNPDLATPRHIVDKLREAALKAPNHRYSASKGITRLRMAICDWYKRRYQVDLDPESESIVTIGAKEGISHLVLAMTKPGDVDHYTRVRAYLALTNRYYPADRVLLSLLPSVTRAAPRLFWVAAQSRGTRSRVRSRRAAS